ncbi:MAG TPA: HTTM domain-containing protein [Kofleriaceae bacterium]
MAKKRKRGGGPRKQGGKPAQASASPKPARTDDDAKLGSDDKPKSQPAKAVEPPDDKPQSRGALRRQAARSDRAARPVSPRGPAPDPIFWFGFEVPWAKLLVARVVVFALLAIDALMQIEHAPRYGAGGFNVAQLPLLDALAPGRILYSAGQLVLAYLFVLVACGALTRYALPIATAIYGWLYFASHLDSYQHHYLVFLILVIACFVPWERPAGATASTPVRSWALRLLYIQLALLYLWAAVSKMNAAWLDGKALSMQMTGTVRSMIDATIGIKGAAWLVLISELVLAATVWNKRTWVIAAPLGVALHAGILATSLDIGLFAWLMLGLYLLVLPDRVFERFARATPREDRTHDGVLLWIALIMAGAVGILLAAISRFDHGFAVGLVAFAAVVVATALLRRRVSVARLAIAHVLAFGVWTAVDRTTKTASDYYRLWGGSAKRLGDPKTSEAAYRRMTEIAPDEEGGHYQLGKLLLERGADDEGIAELHKAQDVGPLKARAYLAEARWLATKGRTEEAIAKAREATIVEPNDQEASALLNSLLPK